ncbi:MAG: prepilin-type N-terminal cleavage/methylation domain-containing protein [Gammaproteobacteria bacterium]|nr:prepilin-type N-terminal cleavage/methylation domain-containing protein [Gammaproteobacteria bacterium]MBP9729051.1 prepilin-type N-terminal cleavage/methylation domain-containing protein [Gammaproteobacteria bacterium]
MKKISQGVGLIELVISMAILSIALLGSLISINTVILSSSDPLLVQQAVSIAESYLQEIGNRHFPISPCPAAIRSNYSNICHYQGLSESPTDQEGNSLAALSDYTVTVNVDNTTESLGSFSGSTAVARVDVTVSHSSMQTIQMSAYKTNH